MTRPPGNSAKVLGPRGSSSDGVPPDRPLFPPRLDELGQLVTTSCPGNEHVENLGILLTIQNTPDPCN
jgi:hypothetical protein